MNTYVAGIVLSGEDKEVNAIGENFWFHGDYTFVWETNNKEDKSS